MERSKKFKHSDLNTTAAISLTVVWVKKRVPMIILGEATF